VAALAGSESKETAKHPGRLQLVRRFELAAYREPEPFLWPGYFWLWNAPLDGALLREQLRDMAAHDARSVCMLPMPHAFRPEWTNNSMEPDYLTAGYFKKVREAVEEAAALKIN